MFFVAIFLIVFGLAVAFLDEELVKLILALAWAGMALMAAGSFVYALLTLL